MDSKQIESIVKSFLLFSVKNYLQLSDSKKVISHILRMYKFWVSQRAADVFPGVSKLNHYVQLKLPLKRGSFAVVKVIDFSKFTDEVCILLLEASLPLHIERNVGNAHIKSR